MNVCSRSLREKVSEYLEYRRNLGFTLHTDGYLLRSFADYADRHVPGQPVTIKLALEWATLPQTGNRTYHAKRLDALRVFARHLALSEPETEIPPGKILGPSIARAEPYIYSQKEILTLMATAQKIMPYYRQEQTAPIRNATVIGLLACTGMRIGEVLRLENRDVDLKQGVILVRESKNLPMRLVPLAQGALPPLRSYQRVRDRFFGPTLETERFFMSAYGRKLSYTTFFHAFKRILAKAGFLADSEQGVVPRIHDLRHTFACNHLLRAYQENRDIDNAVHELSVYLGHATLNSTYWYLTGIPALFELCSRRFEAQADTYREREGL